MPNYRVLFNRLTELYGEKDIHSNNLPQTSSKSKGFTLIEYLVVITILGTVIGGLIITFDPFGQLNKGEDAQRRQDIQQVKNALEAYYQDFQCYPAELNFGEEFSSNGEVYMVELPEDPSCGQSGGNCYEYITDTENECPQWNVVFARLASGAEGGVCPLSSISDTCVPDGYDSEWACVLSGAVNCPFLASSGIGYDSGSGGGSGEPTATPVIQTGPVELSENSSYRVLGGQSKKNPYMRRLDIDPWWAEPDTAQTFVLMVEDATSDVTSVKIHLFSDSGVQILTLNHDSGTPRSGTWSGTISADTYNNIYAMAIVSENESESDACTVVTNEDRGGGAEADAICDAINS